MADISIEQLSDKKWAEIGGGAFGRVYKGEYLGTPVAIKELLNIQSDDFDIRKYMSRELTVVRELHHPHIVQYMGICVHDGVIYIVTEWIPGGDVADLLHSKKPVGWERKLQIIKDVAVAMAFIHTKGLMHRDLKPANLLIAGDGKVKVCDFGFARSYEDGEPGKKKSLDNQMTILGTDEYMAPEVELGMDYDETCDLFSYGCVAIEIITRKEPPKRYPGKLYAFQPGQIAALLEPSKAPAALIELIEDCCEAKPQDRPTFLDVVSRLTEIIETFPEELLAEEEEAPSKGKAKKDSSDEVDEEEAEWEKTEGVKSIIKKSTVKGKITEVQISKKYWRSKKPIEFQLSADVTNVVPGETLSFNVSVENGSKKQVSCLESVVVQQVPGKKGKKKSTPVGDVIKFTEDGRFPLKTSLAYEGWLEHPVPKGLVNKDERSYELEVRCVVKGGSNLVLHLPLNFK